MVLPLGLTILLSVFFSSLPQEELSFENELEFKSKYISLDKLGYLYMVDGSLLKKVNLKTNQIKNYSNKLSGHIHSIDVSDPFRVLLYYKDFNKIEWLDKNLAQIISPVSLDELGYFQVTTVCQSVNGGFWLFDQSLNQLVYIDKNLKSVNRSAQLTEMIDQNTDLEHAYMLEKNDYIYLGINGKNILLFDTYGTYIKAFPINYNKTFGVNNGVITYYNEEGIFFYNTSNYSTKRVKLGIEGLKQAIIISNKIYINTGTKILVYHVNNF